MRKRPKGASGPTKKRSYASHLAGSRRREGRVRRTSTVLTAIGDNEVKGPETGEIPRGRYATGTAGGGRYLAHPSLW